MSKKYQFFDEAELRRLVPLHYSYSSILRVLGRKPVGGSVTNLNARCKQLSIDVSHFKRTPHNKGAASNRRKTPVGAFVLGTPQDRRPAAHILRRCMLEIGIPYKCSVCSIESWNEQAIVLEIDHIDSRYWNNQRDNLQFLCPNCHSQKTKNVTTTR